MRELFSPQAMFNIILQKENQADPPKICFFLFWWFMIFGASWWREEFEEERDQGKSIFSPLFCFHWGMEIGELIGRKLMMAVRMIS